MTDLKPIIDNLANLTLSLEKLVVALMDLKPEELEAQASEPEPAALEPIEEQQVITIEEIRKFLAEKSQNGKQPEVKRLINSYGVHRLTEIDPAHYPDLLEQAEAL